MKKCVHILFYYVQGLFLIKSLGNILVSFNQKRFFILTCLNDEWTVSLRKLSFCNHLKKNPGMDLNCRIVVVKLFHEHGRLVGFFV